MALSKPVKDPLYVNFLCVGLGLQHLQEGLADFVQSNVEQYHCDLLVKAAAELKSTLPIDCSKQTFFPKNNNNIPRFQCRSCTSYSIDKSVCDKNCQNIVCNTLANQISIQHRIKKPNWKNSDASLWTRDPWEVAKCFLPPGYINTTSAKDTDATGLLNIIIFMKHFGPVLGITDNAFKGQTDIFSMCKEVRNVIQHSPRQELDSTKKIEYLGKIEAALNMIPMSNGTTTALTSISNLKAGKLPQLTDELIDAILSVVTIRTAHIETDITAETQLGLETIKEATKTETQKGIEAIKDATETEAQLGLDTIKEATKTETKKGLDTIKAATKTETQLGLDSIKATIKTETQLGLDKIKEVTNAAADITQSETYESRHQAKSVTKWMSQENYFVTTRATEEAKKLIKTEQCLVVTGSSGCGKSTLVQHLALDLMKKGYNINIAKGPKDIVYTNKKQVFVLEDPFGNNSIMMNEVLVWEKELQQLQFVLQISDEDDNFGRMLNKQDLGHTIILMSSRLNIHKSKQLKQIKDKLKIKECNICSKTLCLTQNEKEEIFKKYVKADVAYDQVCHDYEYFPLICRLSFQKDAASVQMMFKNPPKHIQTEIQNMKNRNKHQFFWICLCVMFEKGFRKMWLENWSNEKNLNLACAAFKPITEIIQRELCLPSLESKFAMSQLLDALDELEGSYCKVYGDTVTIVHDKVYDIAAKECGQSLFSIYLKYASSKFITERYIFVPQEGDMTAQKQFFIKIEIDKIELFFHRVLKGIQDRSIDLMQVSILRNELVQTKFVNYVIKSNQLKSIELANQSPLCLAVHCEYINLVRMLLNYGANTSILAYRVYIDMRLPRAVSIIPEHAASLTCNIKVEPSLRIDVRQGNTESICLLKKYDQSISFRTFFVKNSLLHICTNQVYIFWLGMVLEVGALVNKLSRNFFKHSPIPYCEVLETPLYMAVDKGYTDCVRMLLEHGADISLCNAWGNSPLYIAVDNNNIECASMLLKHGADTSLCNIFGMSPLLTAVYKGNTDCVCMLLKHNADPSLCETPGGDTPLHIAVDTDNADCVRMLLDHGANTSVGNLEGNTPLFKAIFQCHTECASMLLKHGADTSLCNDVGISPLHVAAHNGPPELVSMLLTQGADTSLCTFNRDSPLHISVYRDNNDSAQMLLKHGAEPSLRNIHGETPLHVAIDRGNMEGVSMLLEHSADPSWCNVRKISPLHIAVHKGSTECTNMLLKYGADTSMFNEFELSPLHLAVLNGYTECVSTLLKHGADASLCNKYEYTPLHIAVVYGYTESASILLKHGADASFCNNRVTSPLHEAVFNSNIECVRMLLRYGADTSLCDASGDTPLHIAVRNDNIECARILLMHHFKEA